MLQTFLGCTGTGGSHGGFGGISDTENNLYEETC